MIGIEVSTNKYIAPDRNPRRRVQAQVAVADFGDGYEYRLPTGYNNFQYQFNLTFNNRPVAEIDELEDFFISQRGSTPFDYKFIQGVDSSGNPEEVTIKCVCEQWNVTDRSLKVGSLGCRLRRVYA